MFSLIKDKYAYVHVSKLTHNKILVLTGSGSIIYYVKEPIWFCQQIIKSRLVVIEIQIVRGYIICFLNKKN